MTLVTVGLAIVVMVLVGTLVVLLVLLGQARHRADFCLLYTSPSPRD